MKFCSTSAPSKFRRIQFVEIICWCITLHNLMWLCVAVIFSTYILVWVASIFSTCNLHSQMLNCVLCFYTCLIFQCTVVFATFQVIQLTSSALVVNLKHARKCREIFLISVKNCLNLFIDIYLIINTNTLLIFCCIKIVKDIVFRNNILMYCITKFSNENLMWVFYCHIYLKCTFYFQTNYLMRVC